MALNIHLHSKSGQENGDWHELRTEVVLGLVFFLFVVAPVGQGSGAADAFVVWAVETAAGVAEREQAGRHRFPES
jgi:hypothetical protein